jgi:DamX protein
MSALAHNNIAEIKNKSVTTISTNARIDYILRFSKQAVLVVDDNIDVYSQVGSQFLTTLSTNHNAAYVSASAKLNNIQIRCRIIEQLFANNVFDPEQSLAVSVLNLSKNGNQALTIVLDHAHNVSLQIMHELSLLVVLAKKSSLQINVVMLGNYQAGVTIASNKSLFNNTLSILSAKSGQLISPNSRLFQVAKPIFELTFAKKLFLSITAIMAIAIVSVIALFQRDVLSLSQLKQTLTPEALFTDNMMAKLPVVETKALFNLSAASNEMASPKEIFNLLTGKVISKEVRKLAAQTDDIVNAISVFSNNKENIETMQQTVVVKQAAIIKKIAAKQVPSVVKVNKVKVNKSPTQGTALQPGSVNNASKRTLESRVLVSPVHSINERLIIAEEIDPLHYLDAKTGFIIQFSGFTQQYVFDEFVAEYKEINFVGYYRWLNKKPLLILTSKAYNTRQAADKAIALLPLTLQQRGPWVKSLAAVNKEINAFQNNG